MASFSSQGLAFDSGIKPNVAAPGIAIATAEPGAAPDGSALYGTVNGTSGAAATVAGAAALLAQMRPALDGPALESLLAGYAQPGRAPAAAVGAGTLRLGASAVGEVAAQPTTLGFGIWGRALARHADDRRAQRLDPAPAAVDQRGRRRRVGGTALHRRPEPPHAAGRAGRAHPGDRARAGVPAARIVTGTVQIAPAGSRDAPRPVGAPLRASGKRCSARSRSAARHSRRPTRSPRS